MTSIVITPLDPDHAEELKAFIENELDNADFEGEDMPSMIRIEDVTAIKRQRDRLLAAIHGLLNMPDYDGTHDTSVARRTMKHAARIAINDIAKENE